VNLLMADEAFKMVVTGAREFTKEHAQWIHEGCKSDVYSLHDLIRSHDMFLRADVSTEEDMMVSGISRRWLRKGRMVDTETRAQVGLWEVSPGAWTWAQRMGNKLTEYREENNLQTIPTLDVARIFMQDREEIADDPLIMAMLRNQILRGGISTDAAAIVTGDRNLCRRAAEDIGITIYRLSPYALPRYLAGEDMMEKIWTLEGPGNSLADFFDFPKDSVTHSDRTKYVMVDKGSVDEMLSNMRFEDIGFGGESTYKAVHQSFMSINGKRTESFSYIPQVSNGRVSVFKLKGSKDPNGRPFFEIHFPQKVELRKLPKFESYSKGSATSSKTKKTTSTMGGKISQPFVPSEKY